LYFFKVQGLKIIWRRQQNLQNEPKKKKAGKERRETIYICTHIDMNIIYKCISSTKFT